MVLSAVMLFPGCVVVNYSNTGTITAKGEPQTYEYKVGPYSEIKAEGYLEIQYYAAESDVVTLTVPPNIREYCSVSVVNGELIVRTTRRINYTNLSRPILTVSTPVLNRLTVQGACNFIAHDKITSNSLTLKILGAASAKAELEAGSLLADISGASQLNLSGKSDTAHLILAGAGDLNALGLQTREATVSLSGAGTIRISCSEKLNVDARGVGTVDYRGSPGINLSRSGLVSIRQVD